MSIQTKNLPKQDDRSISQAEKVRGRKRVTGFVVSDKMQKTIVVRVDRRVKHGLYSKYITKTCRYKAHDEKGDAKVGDLVALVETRPLSRDKRWALQEIIRKGSQVGAAAASAEA